MTRVEAFSTGLWAGQHGRVELEITADRETKIDFVAATVKAHEGWVVSAGKTTISNALVTTCFDRHHLAGAGVLPVGVTRLAFEVGLPSGLPPPHSIAPASAYVELRVHVSRPWRLDDRFKFRLPMRVPPGPPLPPQPTVWRSAVASSDAPRIELGIADARVAAGDTLVGSCAVFHMDDSGPREVTILLDPILTLNGRGRPRVHHGSSLGMTLTMPPGSAGTSVPFAIRLPPAVTPSFIAPTHALAWQVVARTGGFLSGRVSVASPIQVIDAAGVDPQRRPAIPPGLTDDRVAGVFANFARTNGYAAVAHADAGLTIARPEGDAELQLTYAHRGEAGTFLVARVAYPSLGLGLEVTPSSVLRHVFFRDLEVGVPEWDRAHLVQARDEAQALPVLKPVVPALIAPDTLGALATWTDHAIAFERLVLAVDARDLALATSALERVAAALAAAREQARPPAGVVVDEDAWRELARALAGHLALGDLSIAGTRGGAPVHLGLDFDPEGRPTAVHATVGDPEHAGELARAVTLHLAHPAADVAASAAPGAIAELVAAWPASVVDLHLANGVAAATVPLADPPVADAVAVGALVDALAAVLGALAPEASPYR